MLRRRIRLLALRRVSPRIRRTASLHVAQFGTRPLVPCLTFHKARFLRSICARRRPIGSLNLAHDRFAVPRIDMLYTTLSCLTLSNLIDSNSLDTIMFASLPLPLQNRLTVWGFMIEYAHENEAFVGACDCLHARDR